MRKIRKLFPEIKIKHEIRLKLFTDHLYMLFIRTNSVDLTSTSVFLDNKYDTLMTVVVIKHPATVMRNDS